jgi:cell division protein FtsA
MKKQTIVGIDIGSYATKVVVCEKDDNENAPKILGVGIVETKGMKNGYVVNADEATFTVHRAITEAEKDSGTKIKTASLAIGGVGLSAETCIGTSVVTRADSVITKFDIDKSIAEAESRLDLKNRVILHAFPIAFKVDGKELPTRPDGTLGTKIETKIIFITCFQQHIDDLLAVVHNAGIKVTSFTATPILGSKTILTDLQKNFGCALIDIGSETVSISVFENNVLTSMHVFPIGSLDITKDIALGLRVSPEEAENIKRGVLSFQNIPKKKIDEIIEARLSDIFELIDKYLKKIGRSGLLPAGAIIIGGGSNISMIENVAKSMLKIPVKIGRFEIAGMKNQVKDQRLIVAYSVAVNAEEYSTAKSNKSFQGENAGFMDEIKNFFKQLMP